MSQTEVRIIEPEVTIKIATAQPIGVVDEASLDPANMSSGTATAGQIPTADGVGGIAWADDVGPVPVSRQIINGTGIIGGGDLSADRTLAVNQSALNPANMTSASALSGQIPTANGVGGIAWADNVVGPVSSSNHALVRWDGISGKVIQNSPVILSDTGIMIFPSTGSISKPGIGANSEAFGYGAIANHARAVAVGRDAKISNVTSGSSADAIAIGYNSEIGNSSFPGAGCEAAIAIGADSEIIPGSVDAIAIGSRAIGNHVDAIALGHNATTTGDNRATIGTIGGAADKELQMGKGFAVFGKTPPASQPAKIADPSGGLTQDTEARAALAAILDVLEQYGLTADS